MSRYFSYPPYVPVAERRRKAEAAAKKLAKSGKSTSPVRLNGRTIASTFWGKAWCKNLESYSDYENRLPRGRTYVRNGSVIDLRITSGKVEALVQGSSLYKIAITFSPLSAKRWTEFRTRCANKITNLLDLLQGRLPKETLAEITTREFGLFPAPGEIILGCSCPDSAGMCKHIAAVLYGVGARLDEKPELFFTLRAVDMQELITAASAGAGATNISTQTPDATLAGSDLSEIFGVEIESATTPPQAKATASPASQTKPPTRKKTQPTKTAKSKAKVPLKKKSSRQVKKVKAT